jgi:hypothetical protein
MHARLEGLQARLGLAWGGDGGMLEATVHRVQQQPARGEMPEARAGGAVACADSEREYAIF